jgi:hypothetical protein
MQQFYLRQHFRPPCWHVAHTHLQYIIYFGSPMIPTEYVIFTLYVISGGGTIVILGDQLAVIILGHIKFFPGNASDGPLSV